MQVLLIVATMMVAAIMLPFTWAGEGLSRVSSDTSAEIVSYQIEAYSRAAWVAAHAGADGPINRADLTLPSGFADDPTNPLQARVDDGYLYVWVANKASLFRPDMIFAGADHTIDVGVSSGNRITFRDGETAAPPGWLSSTPNLVIVRIRS